MIGLFLNSQLSILVSAIWAMLHVFFWFFRFIMLLVDDKCPSQISCPQSEVSRLCLSYQLPKKLQGIIQFTVRKNRKRSNYIHLKVVIVWFYFILFYFWLIISVSILISWEAVPVFTVFLCNETSWMMRKMPHCDRFERGFVDFPQMLLWMVKMVK